MLTRLSLDIVIWWSVKGTAIAVLSLVMTVSLRHRPAALRHAVWTVAVLCQLLLPLSSALHPRRILEVRVPARTLFSETVPTTAVRIASAAPARNEPDWRLPTGDTLCIVTLTVTFLLLVRLLAGTLRVQRIARDATPATDRPWLYDLERHCRNLHISRRVRLLFCDRITLPITWGLLRPTILLPASALRWPATLRRHVLLHELGHIRRADTLTQLAGQLATAFFWFNPVLWIATARMRVEAENACDDYVLRDGVLPSIYARTLLDLAHRHLRTTIPAFATLALGRRSDLEKRVRAITDPLRDSSRRNAGFMSVVGAMIALALPLSAIQRATSGNQNRDSSLSDASARSACRPLLVQNAQFFETSGRLTLDGTTAYYFFLRPEKHRCIEASFSMGTEFTADDLDLEKTPGLTALVREKRNDLDRAVRIIEAGGRLRYALTVNGRPAAWDASAQAWYRDMLPEFIRRTSAGAVARAGRILERDGVEGLTAEIARFLDDGARSDYLLALTSLRTPEQLPRQNVMETAKDVLQGDEPALAHFYAGLASREADLPDVRTVILGATTALRDPSDRNIVLEAMVLHRDPSVRISALRAIDILPDDVWRRLLLEHAAGQFLGPDPVLVDAYLSAMRTITNDEDQRLLLEALLRRDLPPVVRQRIAHAAAPAADRDAQAGMSQAGARR